MKRLLHSIALVVAALAGVVVFGLALAAADVIPVTAPSPSPSVEPSPTPWPLSPGEIAMPAGADCAACHETTGGVIGIKDIPAIPHPVTWGTCTVCHATGELVQTAPGHSGIHADQCLICHTVSVGPAPPPAHPVLPNADCLSCHGVTAPLPSDMAHKPVEDCWLCHLASNSSPASGWPAVGSPAPGQGASGTPVPAAS